MFDRLKTSACDYFYRSLALSQPVNKRFLSLPIGPAVLARIVIHWPNTYQWPPSATFLEPIRLGLRHFLTTEFRPIPQPYNGICVFHVVLDNQSHRIAIDYSDYIDKIDQECLSTASLYFKMQYRKMGYALGQYSNVVLPGGYVTADHRISPLLAPVRAIARTIPAKFDVYGRFGAEFSCDLRREVVERLRLDNNLQFHGGLRKVSYRRSLWEAARSKICIDLPGNGDFCFRLVDYLSVGACVISFPHRTILPYPIEGGHHLVYMKSDLSDLLELCHYYLDHPSERQRIQSNAAKYFDGNLCNVKLGEWYVQQILNLSLPKVSLMPDGTKQSTYSNMAPV